MDADDAATRRSATSKWLDGVVAKRSKLSTSDLMTPRRMTDGECAPQDVFVRFCGHALHLECHEKYRHPGHMAKVRLAR